MSIISPMEWNKKNPMQWDWENLMMLDSTPTEIQKRLKPVEWYVEGDGGLDSGSLNSFGAAGGSGGSGLNLGLASLSKSSKSASINSLSTWDVKETAFMLEAFEAIPDDTNNKKEISRIEPTGTSPTLEASVGSSEPLLSLKLGKQTYFEDATVGSNPRNSSYSAIPGTSPIPAKRSKSNCLSTHVLHCQVEGCNLDLSSAKDYHRKHRVCESHSKSPKVIVGGLERRFCQQCSRFHALSEFDEKKRSCRQRLSNHNARRRKPQTEAANFNTARLSSLSSPYDGKQQMSFVQNKVPVFNKAKPNVNFTWEGTFDSVSSQMNSYMPTELGNVNRQVQLPGSQLLNSVTMQCHDFNRFAPAKGKLNTAEVLNPGVEVSMIASNTGTSQELHRALSLLSNGTRVSCEPKFGPNTIYPVMHVNSPTSISQPAMVAIPQGIQYALSENWQMEQQKITESRVHVQEFQPVDTPYDCGFYSAKMD